MSPDDQKRVAGEAAAALVEDGMVVGLGTGSTAAWFVHALAARRLDIRGVATSEATGALAASLGIPLVDLDAVDHVDLTVDGADEIGPGLALIKGAGAALLREKLVWSASRRCVAIADASKTGTVFGAALLPVEVVAFGHLGTARRLAACLSSLEITARAALRIRDGAPVRTDGGNLIYDIPCGVIADPLALGSALKAVTGVVEHGLFLELTERALVGTDGGVITLYP